MSKSAQKKFQENKNYNTRKPHADGLGIEIDEVQVSSCGNHAKCIPHGMTWDIETLCSFHQSDCWWIQLQDAEPRTQGYSILREWADVEEGAVYWDGEEDTAEICDVSGVYSIICGMPRAVEDKILSMRLNFAYRRQIHGERGIFG